MIQGREYADAIEKVVDMLTLCPECAKSPYMAKRETERTRLFVIAGDRGLAGGYNANVFRLIRSYPDAEMIPIGKRACDRFHSEQLSAEAFGYSDAIGLSRKLCDDFARGEYDRLGIVRTKYISMMTQQTEVKWVLPLEKSHAKPTGILFEPDEETMLNTVIPEYVAGILIASVRESFASEVAARRCAMDSAGKNAQQMIDGLQLAYNRARQGAITQEITEIVAGSGG
jgi:F-type H+-transporting ATPase subunit gamma